MGQTRIVPGAFASVAATSLVAVEDVLHRDLLPEHVLLATKRLHKMQRSSHWSRILLGLRSRTFHAPSSSLKFLVTATDWPATWTECSDRLGPGSGRRGPRDLFRGLRRFSVADVTSRPLGLDTGAAASPRSRGCVVILRTVARSVADVCGPLAVCFANRGQRDLVLGRVAAGEHASLRISGRRTVVADLQQFQRWRPGCGPVSTLPVIRTRAYG